MGKFFELLLKVGTNPQLRAWATKQLINLKHLKPRYKDSFQHSMDKNKVKDILDPKWIEKEYAAKIAYNLKDKVLDITKAKDKVKWLKDQASLNKARFHGKNFRGWADDSVKKIGDDMDAWLKKEVGDRKWFNKTLKKSLDGNKKAGIEIDKYFANIEKINKEKVVPFWPRKKPYKKPPGKAEGGRIGFNKGSKKGGIGDLLTELYRLSEIGPLLASPELIDLIQKIPMAEGGIAGMLGEPRSGYNEGGRGYQDYWTMVQESFSNAGGQDATGMNIQDFAEMYFPRKAEGGRIGLADGDTPSQAWMRDNFYDSGLDDLGVITLDDYINGGQGWRDYMDHGPGKAEGGRIGYDNGGSTEQEDYDAYVAQKEGAGEEYMEFDMWKQFQLFDWGKAEGGRIGMLGGGLLTSGIMNALRMVKDIGYAMKGRKGGIPWPGGDLYPKGFKSMISTNLEKALALKQQLKNNISGYKDILKSFKKEKAHKFEIEDARLGLKDSKEGLKKIDKYIEIQPKNLTKHAQGGRIGFKDGEGVMSRVGDMVDVRNVPYYGGKALQGLVNSAETLSKFPLAAGKLTSDLIQKPGFEKVTRQKSDDPMEELFLQQTGQDYKLKPTEVWGEALENIAPGSWSENLGLTSLVEGMGEKRPDDAQTVGNLLGLGTEVAVPTGGAFKAGQFLLSKASKAMGKVKDGKTLEKLVEDKISDSGQSRRDFMSLVGGSGLGIALKSIGLGGLFKAATKVKPSDDVVMRLRTWIDDSDVDTEWGPQATAQWAGAFDVEGLSTAAVKTLKKIMKKMEYKDDNLTAIGGELIPTGDASYVLDALKKAGHKVKFEHLDEAGGMGVDDVLDKFKNSSLYKGTKEGAENYKKFKEKTDKWSARKKAEYHNDITDDYGDYYDEGVADFFDSYFEDDIAGHVIKKAEGGRIGLGTGGPPLQLGIAETKWQAMHPVQGNKISQLKDAAMDRALPGTGLRGSLNMGNFEAFYNQPVIDPMNMFEKSGEPKYGLQYDKGGFEAGIGVMPGGEREYGLQYEKGPFSAGVGARPGGEREYRFKVRKEFNDGGLTKTIPPERGPDPQGLPSALYNGIMRPRSY